MTEPPAQPTDHSAAAPPMSWSLFLRLSLMMFLQYAIWGAWLPLLWPYLSGYQGFQATQIGTIFAVGAIGAILAPFIAGQVVDRYFSTERFLGISHLTGALLIGSLAYLDTYWAFLAFSLVYSIIYSPTLPLTNSLAFHHLPDRDRDFGKVRVWGTVGWIAVGIAMGQWLAIYHKPSDHAAARQMAELHLVDPAGRTELNSTVQLALSGNGGKLTGEVVERNSEQLVLRMRDRRGEQRKEIAIDEIESETPMFDLLFTEKARPAVREALAKIEEGEPAEGVIDTLLQSPAATGENSLFEIERLQAFQQQAIFRGEADCFRLSCLLGLVMGVFCFFLPHTPPQKGEQSFAFAGALREITESRALLVLFLIAVPVSCIHQFYFVHTANFLGTFDFAQAEAAIKIVFGEGGGGLMTVGQMSELFVLALMPLAAKRIPRKWLLLIGITAYGLRMALFGYALDLQQATGIPAAASVVAGVALHGFCFGCFIFVAFLIVDEETSSDVRGSAQSLFNLVIVGIGIIVGSQVAGIIAQWYARPDLKGGLDFTSLFNWPLGAAVLCFLFLLVFYPSRGGRRAERLAAK